MLSHKSYEMLLGHFWLPAMRVFIINDPKWVERILITEPFNYPKHRLMHESLEPLIGSSPFTTNGSVWARQRRMLDQAFGHARLSLVFPLMQQACEDMLTRLAQLPENQPLDGDATMTHVTADIVYRTIFSTPLGEAEAASLFVAFTRYQEFAQKVMVCKLLCLPVLWYDYRRRQYAAVIKAFLGDKARRRFEFLNTQEEQDGADILSGLRCAIDPDDGSVLTEQEVLDQVAMLFLAGHETSASALTWAAYLIANAPEVQERTHNEVMSRIADRQPALADMRYLDLVRNVFRESLRLFPPVGFMARQSAAACPIGKKNIEKGATVVVSPWLIQRHHALWDDPDTFNPDRYDNDASRESLKHAYLPFGMGPRVCMGAAFALQEATLILASLVRKYRISSLSDHEPQPVGRLTIRSANGVQLQLHQRKMAV